MHCTGHSDRAHSGRAGKVDGGLDRIRLTREQTSTVSVSGLCGSAVGLRVVGVWRLSAAVLVESLIGDSGGRLRGVRVAGDRLQECDAVECEGCRWRLCCDSCRTGDSVEQGDLAYPVAADLGGDWGTADRDLQSAVRDS